LDLDFRQAFLLIMEGDNLIFGLTVSFRSMVDIRKVASSLMGYQSMFSEYKTTWV